MDEVLQKRYRRMLEHRETDLVEMFPPTCWADRLSVTTSLVWPIVERSSTTVREPPLAAQPILIVAPSSAVGSGHTEVVEDSNDGIISDVRRVIAKR